LRAGSGGNNLPMSRPRPRAVVFAHPPLSRRAIGRMAVGGLLVTVFGWLVGAALLAATPITPEEQLIQAVAEARDPAVTRAAEAVSGVGSFWTWLAGTIVALPLLRLLTRGWEASWLLALALFGSLAVTGAVKFVIVRDRPLEALVSTYSPAFPSGHASRTAAVVGLGIWAVLALARHPAVRAGVIGLLVVGILAMGWSRLYLTVHWPTDILIGWAIGAWWLLVLLHAVGPRLTAVEAVPPDAPQIATPDRRGG
jgi:membrane-associated phospholipid phosphatase